MVRERAGFNHKGVFVMGLIMLVSGVSSVVLGGVQIGIRSQLGYIGYAIWCGLIFTVTGILGITSWRFKNNCNIIALMVMCIITSVFAFVMLIHACVSIGLDVTYNDYRHYSSTYPRWCYWCKWAVPLEAILIFIALFVFVTSIVCSAFCCKAVCCTNNRQQGAVIGYAPGQQQVIVAAPGTYPAQAQQVVYIPNQHMPQQYIVQGYAPPQPVVTGVPQGQMVAPPGGQPQAQAAAPPVYSTVDENKMTEGSYNYTKLQ